MKNSVWGALALAATSLGCATGPSDTPGLAVTVYGSDGRPATADDVYWTTRQYIDNTGHWVVPPKIRGTCVDATCTRWTWTELPVGDFEVQAYDYTPDRKEHPLCTVERSGERKATRLPDEMLVLAIHLDHKVEWCA